MFVWKKVWTYELPSDARKFPKIMVGLDILTKTGRWKANVKVKCPPCDQTSMEMIMFVVTCQERSPQEDERTGNEVAKGFVAMRED